MQNLNFFSVSKDIKIIFFKKKSQVSSKKMVVGLCYISKTAFDFKNHFRTTRFYFVSIPYKMAASGNGWFKP